MAKVVWLEGEGEAGGFRRVHGFPVFSFPDGGEVGVAGFFHGMEYKGSVGGSMVLQYHGGLFKAPKGALGRLVEFTRERPGTLKMIEGTRTSIGGREVLESYVCGALRERLPRLVKHGFYCEWFLPTMWRLVDPTDVVRQRVDLLLAGKIAPAEHLSLDELAVKMDELHRAQDGDMALRAEYRRKGHEGVESAAGAVASEAHFGFRSFEMFWAAKRVSRLAGCPADVYCGGMHQWDMEYLAANPGFEAGYVGSLPAPLRKTHDEVIVPFYDGVERAFLKRRGEFAGKDSVRLLQWLLSKRGEQMMQKEVFVRVGDVRPEVQELARARFVRPIDLGEFREAVKEGWSD